LRIGFLIDSFTIGGTELNAIKVAESLSRRSVALTVFHFQDVGPLRERYESIGADLIHVPLHHFISMSAVRAIAQINRESRARNVQLLHTHCVYSNVLGAGVRRLSTTRMPLLASRRWTGYAARKELHTLNAYAQSAADAVLVNSPGLVSVVRKESPRAKPVYVPNILPPASFRIVSTKERQAARAAVGLPVEGMIVGYVARLVPVKDHRTLLKAWQRVAQRRPDAALAIIGTGALRSELETYAHDMGIADSVYFTGELRPESLPHALVDIAVMTSLDEGFPNSLLEAMAQRVPVIATNVGGVPDLIVDCRNGLLVAKGDDAALADAVTNLLADGSRRSLLAQAGAITSEAHREEPVTDALMNLYGSLIKPAL
jgi:glycosyltransferase involved in cell wall biosynthesis